MASGPEMLLKAFGIDPKKIIAELGPTIGKMVEGFEAMCAAQARIEAKLDLLLSDKERENGITIARLGYARADLAVACRGDADGG